MIGVARVYRPFRWLLRVRVLAFLLFGIPPLAYLVLAAWNALGLPFPDVVGIQWTEGHSQGTRQYPWPGIPTFFTFDGYSMDLVYPLDGPFRKLVAPLALIGLFTGSAIGLLRPKLRVIVPAVVSVLVVVAWGAFMVWNGLSNIAACNYSACYNPGSLLQGLGVHNLAHGARAFFITMEVMAIAALATILSIWSGVEITNLFRTCRARTPGAG